jgi:hypothetical protein
MEMSAYLQIPATLLSKKILSESMCRLRGKSFSLLWKKTSIDQTVASHYTYWAIPAKDGV